MAKQSQTEIDQMIQRSQCKNRDLVRRDIIRVIQSSECNLILNLIPYYSNDGKYKEYLCLTGTVNCQYKQNRYNIPIEINLSENHPYDKPICRVKPTSNMYISSTNTDVQSDGSIIINYLQTWRHPNSDLYNLINSMSQSFSRSPPVYSSSTVPNPTTPYPQYSPSNVINPTTPYPQYSTSTATNQTTPYPTNISSMPMPMGTNSSYLFPNTNVYPTSERQNQREIPEDVYHESLRTAVLDKIRNRYIETIEIKRGEINSLNKTEQDLNDGFNQIQQLLKQIQQQQIQTQNYITNLRKKSNEVSDQPSSKPNNSIKDDAVIIQSPIYKQIFQSFIEEHAIQDLLFYLADGLQKKSISLDNYLKHVRELSRKQFILRALMIKCRQLVE